MFAAAATASLRARSDGAECEAVEGGAEDEVEGGSGFTYPQSASGYSALPLETTAAASLSPSSSPRSFAQPALHLRPPGWLLLRLPLSSSACRRMSSLGIALLGAALLLLWSLPAALSVDARRPMQQPPPPPAPHTAAEAGAVRCASSFPASYSALYARYRPVCESPGVNAVRNRADGEYSTGEQMRPWSLTEASFHQPSPPCRQPQQLLSAVANGQRRPLPGYELPPPPAVQPGEVKRADVEWARSYFVPAGCSLRWLAGEDVCSLLNGFSHVQLIGDSHLRHILQAVFLLLTEELQFGALPRLSLQPGLYDSCRCDGQFSETEVCRSYEGDHMFQLRDPRPYGVCTAASASNFTLAFHLVYGTLLLPDMTGFCSADSRPRLLLLQAASHWHTDPERTRAAFLSPILEHVRALQAACPHRNEWRIVWLAGAAQSRLLDARYPHQSREQMADFNRRMADTLLGLGIPVIESWNLTLNAATSDGLHFLTDVNMQRATSILNFLSLSMQSETQSNASSPQR